MSVKHINDFFAFSAWVGKRGLIFSMALLLNACAQIAVLTGGPKDESAPTIDSAKTYPINGTTDFSGDQIEIRFDEYILLNKPKDNILISPRPALAPIISSHNKTLKIEFQEPLLDNTTYTINFNRAITDITEKNDSVFQYVFSTGTWIDSFSIRGTIKDAWTNLPSENFVVALYPLIDSVEFDSIPRKLKPTYLAQSDKQGNFAMNYLHYGLYYAFAFDDRNKNLYLDHDEALAFLPEKTLLVNDENIQISLVAFFPEQKQSDIRRINFSAPGKIEVLLTAPADSFVIETPTCALLKEETGHDDSLVFWLEKAPIPKMIFIYQLNGVSDTIKPVYKNSEKSAGLNIISNIDSQTKKLKPEQNLELTFSEPILQSEIKLDLIVLMDQDSNELTPVISFNGPRTMVIENMSENSMSLVIDSGAVKSVYGTVLNEDYSIEFSQHPDTWYGTLLVNITTENQEPALIYLLFDGEIVDSAGFTPTLSFEQLPPGDYQLQIVYDRDQNGIWTNGSLPDGRIPEKVVYFNEIITVRSRWDMEIDWILSDIEN